MADKNRQRKYNLPVGTDSLQALEKTSQCKQDIKHSRRVQKKEQNNDTSEHNSQLPAAKAHKPAKGEGPISKEE
jgi:hypothetical protein